MNKITTKNNLQEARAKPGDQSIYFGLLFFLVLEYFNPVAFFPFLAPLKLNTIVPLGVFTLWLLKGQRKLSLPLQDKLFLGLFILVAVSIVHALITIQAFEKTKQFFGYLLGYFFISRTITTPKRLTGVFWTLTCIHIAIFLTGLEVFTNQERVGKLTGGYFLGDGNDFALSANIAIPMAIFLFVNSQRLTARALSGAFLLGLIAIIILTQSRGASIALFGIMLLFWIRSKRKIYGTVLIGLAVLAVLVFGSESYWGRMSSIAHYKDDTSAQGRLDAWKAGFKMALDHPILGVGAGNFNSVYGRYYRVESAVHPRWISSHSTYVQCMTELGFTGLLLLVGLILTNFRDCAYMRRDIRSGSAPDKMSLLPLPACFEASIIGLVINMGFLTTLYYPHLFILTGIIVSAKSITTNNMRLVESMPPKETQ